MTEALHNEGIPSSAHFFKGKTLQNCSSTFGTDSGWISEFDSGLCASLSATSISGRSRHNADHEDANESVHIKIEDASIDGQDDAILNQGNPFNDTSRCCINFPEIDEWLADPCADSDSEASYESDEDDGEDDQFRWSIDQMANLIPVDIETKEEYMEPDKHAFTPGRMKRFEKEDAMIQKQIDQYFHKSNRIVPSPWVPRIGTDTSTGPPRSIPATPLVMKSSPLIHVYKDPEEATRDSGCQTMLSCPPHMSLREFFLSEPTDAPAEEDSVGADTDSFLRRRLFSAKTDDTNAMLSSSPVGAVIPPPSQWSIHDPLENIKSTSNRNLIKEHQKHPFIDIDVQNCDGDEVMHDGKSVPFGSIPVSPIHQYSHTPKRGSKLQRRNFLHTDSPQRMNRSLGMMSPNISAISQHPAAYCDVEYELDDIHDRVHLAVPSSEEAGSLSSSPDFLSAERLDDTYDQVGFQLATQGWQNLQGGHGRGVSVTEIHLNQTAPNPTIIRDELNGAMAVFMRSMLDAKQELDSVSRRPRVRPLNRSVSSDPGYQLGE